MNALVAHTPANAEVYRASTDAAGLCREIVMKTAMDIQNRKYVKVEGWQAIAIAHGCTGSARDVEKIDGGVRAVGEIRRMSDGALIAQAEGFVGEDEPTWFGGEVQTRFGKKTLPKRPDFAIRAMAQTRAISRAARSAFAHVVVMIDANLSTTPYEEMAGVVDAEAVEVRDITPAKAEPARQTRKAPPAEKPVDRTGDVVPPPTSQDADDWTFYRKIIASKIKRADSAVEVGTIQTVNAEGLTACCEVLPDTKERIAAFVEDKLAQLGAAGAEAA